MEIGEVKLISKHDHNCFIWHKRFSIDKWHRKKAEYNFLFIDSLKSGGKPTTTTMQMQISLSAFGTHEENEKIMPNFLRIYVTCISSFVSLSLSFAISATHHHNIKRKKYRQIDRRTVKE